MVCLRFLPVVALGLTSLCLGCVPTDLTDRLQSADRTGSQPSGEIEANNTSLSKMRQEQKSLLAQGKALQLFRAGRVEQGLQVMENAIARYPQDANLLLVRGVMLRKIGRLEESLADLDRVLQLDPANCDALCQRAFVSQSVGSEGWAEQSLADTTMAVELGYQGSLVHILAGNAEFELGRFDQALAQFDRAIELSPDSPNSYAGRARVWIELGKLHRAAKDLDQAYQLNPAQVDRAEMDRLRAQLEMQQQTK